MRGITCPPSINFDALVDGRQRAVVRLTSAWYVELTYKDPERQGREPLLYRHDETAPRSRRAGPALELRRRRRALPPGLRGPPHPPGHLFDPVLAVHTSLVDPLPHQITAVYEAMLPRQPLRFLLADDPGAGKTIMAGLLIKELIARGDLQRCLIVCPGSLAEQWQDELAAFHLPFEILTNDKLEPRARATGS
jgi:SNF2 family DNA or RNA helicase